MVRTSRRAQSLGLLTAFFACTLMAQGTAIVQAGPSQTQDSSLSPAGVKIAMSPEEKAQHEIHVPPKKGGKKQRLTKKQKLDICARDPQCRASLEAANQGKHPKPIPAVTPGSPEDNAHKIPYPPKAKKPKGQRSELQPEPSSSLLSWLNPFSVSVAEAQTAPPPGFPVRAEAPYYIVPGKLEVRNYGGMTRGGDYYLYKTWPGPASITGNNGRNYIPFYVTVPVQGYYIIDVEGTPARAHVNIPYNGTPYNYPDFSTQPSGSEQHYVSIPYLAAGSHWFYFWIDAPSSARIDAVEVDFYR